MDNEDTYIYGYIEKSSDTALCVLCTQVVYAYSLATALGQEMIFAIRHYHADKLHETLHCVKCGAAILAPTKPDAYRLSVWREFVESTDLGKELKA